MVSASFYLSRWFRGRRPIGFASLLGVFVVAGCGTAPPESDAVNVAGQTAARETPPTHSDGLSSGADNARIASASQRFEHDAGVTLAGTLVSHSFTVENAWGREVSVRSETDDVIINCGCTKFSLAKYNLAPGERTNLDVSLDTSRRSGAVKKGGEIIWSASDGTRYSTKFAIACDVKNAFDVAPSALSFGAEDVAHGTVKEIRLASSFRIDWKSITASSASEAFRVVECNSFDAGAVCRVECVARGEVECADALLRFAARGHSDGRAVTAELPLHFQQVLALVAYPPLVSVRLTGEGSGTAKILLRGSALKSGRVATVTADGFNIEWSWSAAAVSPGDMGFLNVRLRRTGEDVVRCGDLAIICGSGDVLKVQFVIAPAADLAPARERTNNADRRGA